MPTSEDSVSFCVWDESCRVGIGMLDEQHQGLFASLNRLHDALMSHSDPAAVSEELATLMRLTRSHFDVEEEFMRVHHYPGYQTHKQMHDLLVSQLADVIQLESNEFDQPWAERLELADFLHAWLVSHILDEDKKIAAFLKIGESETS